MKSIESRAPILIDYESGNWHNIINGLFDQMKCYELLSYIKDHSTSFFKRDRETQEEMRGNIITEGLDALDFKVIESILAYNGFGRIFYGNLFEQYGPFKYNLKSQFDLFIELIRQSKFMNSVDEQNVREYILKFQCTKYYQPNVFFRHSKFESGKYKGIKCSEVIKLDFPYIVNKIKKDPTFAVFDCRIINPKYFFNKGYAEAIFLNHLRINLVDDFWENELLMEAQTEAMDRRNDDRSIYDDEIRSMNSTDPFWNID